MNVTVKYGEKVKQDLEKNEQIISIFAGRTAPVNWVMKLLPKISWLTKVNRPMVLAITNQWLLVYKQQINTAIQLAMAINRSDISKCEEANGVLNGAIQIALKDNQLFKFVFKKERITELLKELNK